MKHFLFLPLFAAALSAAPVLSGPPTAITGQQSVFSVQGATAPFAWFAVPPGEDDSNVRKVNNDRPALVTTWQGRPGKWRVWVEDATGRSNELSVNVMNDRVETVQLVPEPNAVVAWTEQIQKAPRGASSKELAGVAVTQSAKRVIPQAPDTPTAASSVGLANSQLAPGEAASNNLAADEDGSTVILSPNADNVVDLAAQLIEPEEPGSLRNPFVRVRSGNAKPRELKLLLSAVVLGPRTSAVLNDQVHTINDSVAGSLLRVAEITRDYATLRTGRFLLRIPIDVPTTIRLPN